MSDSVYTIHWSETKPHCGEHDVVRQVNHKDAYVCKHYTENEEVNPSDDTTKDNRFS